MNEEKQNYEIDSDNNKINDKKEINENNIIKYYKYKKILFINT